MAELARHKRWRLANPEKIRAYKKRYDEEHREELRAKAKERYEERKEARSAWSREYLSRPEVLARRETQREYRNAQARKWRARNPERVAANWRAWYENNHARAIANAARGVAVRKARKAAASRVESIDRFEVFERDAGRCHLCKRHVSPTNFHLDHLVPLSKGGDHTYDNVAVAHPRCNLRRNDGKIPAQLRLLGRA